jgi:apolipoprotein D and lipocalin family protein
LNRVSLTVFAMLTLSGCASRPPLAPEPAKPIDAARFFTGRWYEIARTPMSLTTNCVAGTTDYYRRPSGQLIDRDACRMNTPEGTEKTYSGPVTILNPGQNNKVRVTYIVWGFIPIDRTYWMLDHDVDYTWFIVADPSFKNLSLFTRTPRPSERETQMLVTRASELGYPTQKLEFPTEFPTN